VGAADGRLAFAADADVLDTGGRTMQLIAPAHPDGRHMVDRLAVRDMLPVIVSIAPFGMLVGVSVGALATHPAGALFGSLLIYGGSAQLAATTLLDTGGGLLAILGSVVAIQARLLLYGAGLEPLFRDQPALFRWLAPATIVDQTYASALARQDTFGTATRFRRYWWSAGGVLGVGWLAAIGAGMGLGPVLPASSPMSIAVPAVFVGLLVPRLTSRPAVAAAVAGAVTAAAAATLPNGLGLLLGVAAGAAAGSIAENHR
jgi:predicted branched-subunit amino acid permease